MATLIAKKVIQVNLHKRLVSREQSTSRKEKATRLKILTRASSIGLINPIVVIENVMILQELVSCMLKNIRLYSTC